MKMVTSWAVIVQVVISGVTYRWCSIRRADIRCGIGGSV